MSVWNTEGNVRQNESLSLHPVSFWGRDITNCLLLCSTEDCDTFFCLFFGTTQELANNDSFFFVFYFFI